MYFCAWRSCICKQWSKGTHLPPPSTLVMGEKGRAAPQPAHPACHCLWAALPERDWPPSPTSSCLQLEEPRGSSGEPLPLLSTACRQRGWTEGWSRGAAGRSLTLPPSGAPSPGSHSPDHTQNMLQGQSPMGQRRDEFSF